MKKFFLALCLCALSLCAMAQQNGRPGNRGGRSMIDAVVDTAVINKMDLAPEMLASIQTLMQSKQEAMKQEMQQMRGQRGRMSEEERKAMSLRHQAFNQQYRAELREIMGTDLYITYLEKMLDRRSQWGTGARQNMGQGQGQMRQRPDFQQRGQMQMGGGMDNDF